MRTEATNIIPVAEVTRVGAEADRNEIDRSAGASRAFVPPGGIAKLGGLTLPGMLRGVGGLVVVVAFAIFLFHGWQEGDDLTRYLLLIGHTLALTLAGFSAGHLLREPKGARLFIGLALAAVPVNFAFLGGLSYGHLTWDPAYATQALPAFWQPMGTTDPLPAGTILLLCGAGVFLLTAAIWIGFLVLARRSALRLSTLYLLANAALLIPTRETASISALLFCLGLAIAAAVVGLRRRDPGLATPEGVFARAVLALPLLVIGGRSIWLYAPSDLFFTTFALIGYVGLRQTLGAMAEDDRWRDAVEWSALVMAAVSAWWAFATTAALEGLSDVFKLPIVAACLAVLLVDLSSRGTPRAIAYRIAAVLAVAATLTVNLFLFGGFGNALLCLTGGIAGAGYGYAARHRPIFLVGLAAAVLGMAFAGREVFVGFTIGGWTGLVLIGVATILAGSFIERRGGAVRSALSRWNRHFSEAE